MNGAGAPNRRERLAVVPQREMQLHQRVDGGGDLAVIQRGGPRAYLTEVSRIPLPPEPVMVRRERETPGATIVRWRGRCYGEGSMKTVDADQLIASRGAPDADARVRVRMRLRCSFHNAINSSSVTVAVADRTTTACTASPHLASATPNAPHSITARWRASAASTSPGNSLKPPC